VFKRPKILHANFSSDFGAKFHYLSIAKILSVHYRQFYVELIVKYFNLEPILR
jgi:hypothetical protein